MDYTIFNGFLDGIVITDTTGVVKYVNASAANILKLKSTRSLLNKELVSMFPDLASLKMKAATENLVFSAIKMSIKDQDQPLHLLVGVRRSEDSSEVLVYIRDATIEVNLENKFTSERVERERAMASAETDSLTGCLNKAGLMNCLSERWKRYKESGGIFSIIVLDLDGFKKINDVHGHQAGDDFLRDFSGILVNSTRMRDDIGRFGGDEFVLLMADCNEEETLRLARRVRDEVRLFKFEYNEKQLAVTASIGVAADIRTVSSPGEYLHMADMASLFSKQNGKDQIAVFPNKTVRD